MCWSNFCSRLIALFLLPLFLFYQFDAPAITIQARTVSTQMDLSQIPVLNNYNFSYDDLLDLIEELEEGDLEQRCSVEELWRINSFVAFLARKGILPNQTNEELILDQDIQELLYGDTIGSGFFILPTAFSQCGEILLCKSWFHKRCSQVKKFVKKHKTALIVGAAVVVAVIVVVATAGAATPAAAEALAAAGAAGAGGAAASGSNSDDKSEASEAIAGSQNISSLATVLEEQISSFKELVVEDNLLPVTGMPSDKMDPFFTERARELGAFLAHETLEGITQLTSVVPELFDEIREIGVKILPESFQRPSEQFSSDPNENFEILITHGHEKIDQLFSTDQADHYSTGNEGKNRFVTGMIPPPGVLIESLPVKGRIAATQASDVCGWALGESIRNKTIFGTVPKWSTVRRRYWKNQAYLHREKYEAYELERMEKGLAPQRINAKGEIEIKELHHDPAQRDGGLFDFVEVWPDEHAILDQHRCLGR